MRFWDTSALVPMLVDEASTAAARELLRSDQAMVVSWTTRIECASALARVERTGGSVTEGWQRLETMAGAWHEVEPTRRLRSVAVRLLRVHPVRAADAIQVATALIASEGDPATLPFVTLDDRLAAAADKEGFRVTLPTSQA